MNVGDGLEALSDSASQRQQYITVRDHIVEIDK